jgi:hypothetical protein
MKKNAFCVFINLKKKCFLTLLQDDDIKDTEKQKKKLFKKQKKEKKVSKFGSLKIKISLNALI